MVGSAGGAQGRIRVGSALIGGVSFFVASLVFAATKLAIEGTGPHGYGAFLYPVAAMFFTPAGLVAGLGPGWRSRVAATLACCSGLAQAWS